MTTLNFTERFRQHTAILTLSRFLFEATSFAASPTGAGCRHDRRQQRQVAPKHGLTATGRDPPCRQLLRRLSDRPLLAGQPPPQLGGRHPGRVPLCFRLLRRLQRYVDLEADIALRALKLRMAQDVVGPPADSSSAGRSTRCLGTSH